MTYIALLCYCKVPFLLQFHGRIGRKLPKCFLDWVKKQPEEEKERLRKFIKREK
jgi:hypothetical protein